MALLSIVKIERSTIIYSPEPEAKTPAVPRREVKFATLGCGVVVALVGMLLALGTYLWAVIRNVELQTLTALAAAGAATLVLGSALAWVGWQAGRGRPPAALRLPHPVILLIAWIVIIGLGTGALFLPSPLDVLAFPPLHVLATALPPLLLLALIASSLRRRNVRLTARDTVLHLASGALIAVSLALILEVIFGALLIVGVALGYAIGPGIQELQTLLTQLLDALQRDPDPQALQPLLQAPLILIAIVTMVTVLAPLAEELCKAVGVVFMRYRRPTPAQAFFWGVCGGLGFAFLESLFSSVLTLPNWAGGVLLRSPTTIIHALAGGLMGLAWQASFSPRRRWRFLVYFAAAVMIHGVWNGLVAGVAITGLVTIMPGWPNLTVLSGLLTFGLGSWLILSTILLAYLVLWVTRPNQEELQRRDTLDHETLSIL